MSICHVYSDGTKKWYSEEGKLHRLDGPAIERADGSKEGWVNGERHREDGPAIINADGSKEWWQYDIKLFDTKSDEDVDPNGINVLQDGTTVWFKNWIIHKENEPAIICSDGSLWMQNGVFHRNNGPAVIYDYDFPLGTHKQWWIRGKLHREDGPAIEDTDGTEEWYRFGKRHREDGPAVVCYDGTEEWWINDVLIRVKLKTRPKIHWKKEGF